jgi:hypothetical protein
MEAAKQLTTAMPGAESGGRILRLVRTRRRISLGSLAAGAILVLLILNTAMMMAYHVRNAPTYDFLAFYTAGRIVNEIGPSKMYNLETQRELHRQIEPQTDRRPLWAYLNPPFVALLLGPLAKLSYQGAYSMMALINLVLLVGALSAATGGLRPDARLVCAMGTLASLPAYYVFYNGQLTGLVMLLFALMLHDVRGHRDRRAGIWLAFLLIKPQLMIAPVLVLVWKRRWPILGAAAIVGAILTFISFLMIGRQGASEYLQIARLSISNDKRLAFLAETMHNWRGFFLRAQLGEWSAPATIFACGATLGVLLWIWRGRWRPAPGNLMALVIAALLVSPHCHYHDYVLMGLVLALFAPLVSESPILWLSTATIALASWASFWMPKTFSAMHAAAVIGLVVIAVRRTALRTRAGSDGPGCNAPAPVPVRGEINHRTYL